ncbi:hypothetical protein ACKKBG_A35450 [Auxenochlorella protothecoides x Auxenochlorella symbiontica]
MSLEIAATDVIKVILQFCKENSLTSSFAAIQEECGVSLNAVESLEAFTADVRAGRWDLILPQLATLKLPVDLLEDLYEQVLLELLELRETDTAKPLLRQAAVFARMRDADAGRYARLERLAAAPSPDARDLYGATPRDARRGALAARLAAEVTSVPPSRLMAVIGQALKWQQHQGLLAPGATFDLFRGSAAGARDEVERCPTALDRTIKFGAKSHPETAAFSPDGLLLVTGSADGFIEVWDHVSGKLKKDLAYQAEERFMMHDQAVLALAWSSDSELLASGSMDGKIKVWRVATGQCVRRFDSAHTQGVTSLALSADSSHVLSTSYDGLIRVHGIKSGRMLKEFRGHTSFVNCAVYVVQGSRVLSASADGSVRLWDARSCECLASFRPPPPGARVGDVALDRLLPDPANPGQVYVAGRCSTLYLMTLTGQVLRSFQSGRAEGGDFVAAALSPRGEWAHCLGEDGVLYSFATGAGGRLEGTQRVTDKGPIGVAHHPHRNLLATWSDAGLLSTWKAV